MANTDTKTIDEELKTIDEKIAAAKARLEKLEKQKAAKNAEKRKIRDHALFRAGGVALKDYAKEVAVKMRDFESTENEAAGLKALFAEYGVDYECTKIKMKTRPAADEKKKGFLGIGSK